MSVLERPSRWKQPCGCAATILWIYIAFQLQVACGRPFSISESLETSERYEESLHVQALPGDKVVASFSFVRSHDVTKDDLSLIVKNPGDYPLARPVEQGHCRDSSFPPSKLAGTNNVGNEENDRGQKPEDLAESGDRSAAYSRSENIGLAHFGHFPKLLGQIVSQHQVKELELTFTHGRWNYDQYPLPPPVMGEQGLKVSAELLEDESEGNLRERWSRVKSALAGAFCNSLNLLDEKHTVEDAPPHFYGDSEINDKSNHLSNTRKFYGVLPREVSCTENLSRWIKMLPCRGESGLASLIHSLDVYRGHYSSMKIKLGWRLKEPIEKSAVPGAHSQVENNKENSEAEASGLGSSVGTNEDCSGEDRDHVRKDWACDNIEFSGNLPDDKMGIALFLEQSLTYILPSPAEKNIFSLRDVFGTNSARDLQRTGNVDGQTSAKSELRACPLADETSINIEHSRAPTREKSFGEEVPRCEVKADGGEESGQARTCLEPSKANSSRLFFKAPTAPLEKKMVLSSSLPFHLDEVRLKRNRKRSGAIVGLHRYLTGYGQERGEINIRLVNQHQSRKMLVSYADAIPWFCQISFHRALVSKIQGTKQPRTVSISDPVTEFSYYAVRPAEDHSHPATIRLVTVLDPGSSVTLTLPYDKAFLPIYDHPPDSNRGFDIEAGMAVFYPLRVGKNCTRGENVSSTKPYVSAHDKLHDYLPFGVCFDHQSSPLKVFSEPLLVVLPTPDFSMPYNVIALTSTLVAFFFGSMFNVLVPKPKKTRLSRAVAEKERALGNSKGNALQRILAKMRG